MATDITIRAGQRYRSIHDHPTHMLYRALHFATPVALLHRIPEAFAYAVAGDWEDWAEPYQNRPGTGVHVVVATALPVSAMHKLQAARVRMVPMRGVPGNQGQEGIVCMATEIRDWSAGHDLLHREDDPHVQRDMRQRAYHEARHGGCDALVGDICTHAFND